MARDFKTGRTQAPSSSRHKLPLAAERTIARHRSAGDRGPRAAALPPDNPILREFIADFYAAMSIMRLLRREIASTLSLSSAEFSVLLAVWYLEREGEMTVRAIADHLHVAAAHVTAEIGKLVDKDLLTKRPDPRDGRAVGVSLTKNGRNALQRLTPMLRDINGPLLADSYYRDLVTVQRFLRRVIEHGYDAIGIAQDFKRAENRPTKRKPARAPRD